MKKLLPILVISLLMFSGQLTADDQADLQSAAAKLDKDAQATEGHQRVLTQISKETNVPVATLQAQKTQSKLGYGELLIANSLATASGKTFDQIAALKASGKGWGEIAKENNVKLGDIVQKARHANGTAQPAPKGSAGTGRASASPPSNKPSSPESHGNNPGNGAPARGNSPGNGSGPSGGGRGH